MAITRKQYITVDELNEVLLSTYPDDAATNQLIKEASELISYHTKFRSDTLFDNAASSEERLDLLKIATAYQVEYDDTNDLDDTYADVDEGVSIGKYSTRSGNNAELSGASREWKKVSPKTNRYLTQANLMYSGADYHGGSKGAYRIG